ncbi:MAG TPA: TerC family protein [Acidobacteriota bacterium]|nr:TerC family protein [Acidobacteriota bacterium]
MIELLTAENLIALATLTALEIVLGIDNIVFIAIISAKLPKSQQPRARRLGLAAAMIMRILLLLGITWIMGLTRPLFEVLGHAFSGRDLILLIGGLFLIGKATYEIHDKLEASHKKDKSGKPRATFAAVIAQIMLLDVVFSLDSVITAVGMVKSIAIMIIAVITAVTVMLIFAEKISNFIEKHPTLKMLALSFLLLIGVMLVVEGTGQHVEKGYIYFAMGFSLLVELLNMRVRARRRDARFQAIPSEE